LSESLLLHTCAGVIPPKVALRTSANGFNEFLFFFISPQFQDYKDIVSCKITSSHGGEYED
jgi:hypothetical protein